jgi:uncharacterized membrane protein YoaT (DUF817 family)
MTENNPQNSKSHHILSASSNLLGICFLIFSIIRVSRMHEKTLLDDLCLVGILLFMAASVLSYISIRSHNNQESYEKYADTIFISALSFLCLITIVTVLGLVH